MSATLITITGTFARPDSVPSRGQLLASLTAPFRNGATYIAAQPELGLVVEGKLLADDGLSAFKLYANDDPGSLPPGTTYQFALQLDNEPLRSFYAVVPHTAAAGTIDLSTLEPSE